MKYYKARFLLFSLPDNYEIECLLSTNEYFSNQLLEQMATNENDCVAAHLMWSERLTWMEWCEERAILKMQKEREEVEKMIESWKEQGQLIYKANKPQLNQITRYADEDVKFSYDNGETIRLSNDVLYGLLDEYFNSSNSVTYYTYI